MKYNITLFEPTEILIPCFFRMPPTYRSIAYDTRPFEYSNAYDFLFMREYWGFEVYVNDYGNYYANIFVGLMFHNEIVINEI